MQAQVLSLAPFVNGRLLFLLGVPDSPLFHVALPRGSSSWRAQPLCLAELAAAGADLAAEALPAGLKRDVVTPLSLASDKVGAPSFANPERGLRLSFVSCVRHAFLAPTRRVCVCVHLA